MQLPETVKAKLKTLPDKPGCYLMRDRNGCIIYVGKAVSLRKRVQSYFRDATLKSASPKLRGLVRSVRKADAGKVAKARNNLVAAVQAFLEESAG